MPFMAEASGSSAQKTSLVLSKETFDRNKNTVAKTETIAVVIMVALKLYKWKEYPNGRLVK
jgi:hypothetical protein